MSQHFTDESKKNWVTDGPVNNEQISIGCLQRIANATELMASNYIRLQNDRDLYKRWYEDGNQKADLLRRRVAALQGVITKLKKKQTAC